MQNYEDRFKKAILNEQSPFRVAQEYKDAHEIVRYVARSRNHRYAQGYTLEKILKHHNLSFATNTVKSIGENVAIVLYRDEKTNAKKAYMFYLYPESLRHLNKKNKAIINKLISKKITNQTNAR